MTFNVPGAKFNLMAFNRLTFIEEEEEPLPFSTTIPFYLVSRTTELDSPTWKLQKKIHDGLVWSDAIAISYEQNLYFILKYPGHYRLILNNQPLEEFFVYEFFVDFDANVISGVAPLEVQFNNLSNALEFIFNEYTWYYSHEDDLEQWIEFSKDVAPEHTFTLPGKYNIKLVGNSPYEMNQQSITKNNYIDVGFNYSLEFDVFNIWDEDFENYRIVIINSPKNEIYAILENENTITIDEEGLYHAFAVPQGEYSAYTYPALHLYDSRRNLQFTQEEFIRTVKYKFKIMDQLRSYSSSTEKVNLNVTTDLPTVTNFATDSLVLSIRSNNIYNVNYATSLIRTGSGTTPFRGIYFYDFYFSAIGNNYMLLKIPLNKFQNTNSTYMNQSISMEINLINPLDTFTLDVNSMWIESPNNYSGWTLSSQLYSQKVKYNDAPVENSKIYCISPVGNKIKDVAFTDSDGNYQIYVEFNDILLVEPREQLRERPKVVK